MRIILALVVIGGLVGAAAFAYIYVSGGSGEASEEITAPTLAPQAVDNTGETATGEDRVLFAIVPEESEVRFGIDEELFGQPTRVIGRTNQVAGQILVNFDTPAETEVGTVRINVRTLVTDSENRNRAIRGQILQSSRDEFEFAEFVPSAIEGMPEAVTLGEAFTFNLTGDLTVRDITNPVTFSVTVTPVSETELTGLATAQVTRADYGLSIPRAPGVANVSEQVDLEIEFTARQVSDA